MSTRVLALTETLYCTSKLCDPSRCVRETGFEETLATENEIKMHLRTYTLPTQHKKKMREEGGKRGEKGGAGETPTGGGVGQCTLARREIP